MCINAFTRVSQANIFTVKRLGIVVPPAKVRLIPNTNNAYAWKVLLGKEDFFRRLFTKNLSKHPTSAHKELSAGVRVIFKAVHAIKHRINVLNNITLVSQGENSENSINGAQLYPKISFTAKICQLQDENVTLI